MTIPKNPYRQSRYMLSAHNFTQFPADIGKEVAFVGRSNVGKSSVINTLADQKRLAITSKSPGRTRQINFFSVSGDIRLVDLPGYGFARVDLSLQKQWDIVINRYFSERRSLAGLILIMDIRREVSGEDDDILNWCREAGVPVHILLNKADKLKFQKQRQALMKFNPRDRPAECSIQLFSAQDRTGLEELIGALDTWLFEEKQGPGN